MLSKLKYFLGITRTRPTFVIGTGRSGTHWLGYSLGNHPEVRATVEVSPIFGISTRIALNANIEDELFCRLVKEYKKQLSISAPKLYVDKTHPNIWIAEKLKRTFPKALFIGIERNPYATVASMMRHKGVSDWHRRWREFPIPNRFLGITSDMIDTYSSIPLAAQCAMRWLAHRNRMRDLKETLGDALLIIQYETFSINTKETILELQNFLGLNDPIPVPHVKKESLTKWKTQLSSDEISSIADVVGFAP